MNLVVAKGVLKNVKLKKDVSVFPKKNFLCVRHRSFVQCFRYNDSVIEEMMFSVATVPSGEPSMASIIRFVISKVSHTSVDLVISYRKVFALRTSSGFV